MIKDNEDIKEEVQEEVKEEVKEEVQEEVKQVIVGEVPTQYGEVYQTPDGIMNDRQYLAWMGNLLLEVKQGLIG